jgi:uncharacterized membrane protein
VTRLFFQGLFGILPIIFAVWWIVIDYVVAAEIAAGAAGAIESLVLTLTGSSQEDLVAAPFWAWFFSWGSYVAAILLVLIPLLLISLWMMTGIGARIHRGLQRRLERIPIYRLASDFSRAVGTRIDAEFIRGEPGSVVAVPITESGYALGLRTGSMKLRPDGPEADLVFVPTSPLGLQSRLVLVPQDRVLRTDLPVETTFRITSSLGILPAEEPRES